MTEMVFSEIFGSLLILVTTSPITCASLCPRLQPTATASANTATISTMDTRFVVITHSLSWAKSLYGWMTDFAHWNPQNRYRDKPAYPGKVLRHTGPKGVKANGWSYLAPGEEAARSTRLAMWSWIQCAS